MVPHRIPTDAQNEIRMGPERGQNGRGIRSTSASPRSTARARRVRAAPQGESTSASDSCIRRQSSSSSRCSTIVFSSSARSEEHTSELQSRGHLVCRLLLEKKKTINNNENKHAKKTTS